MLLGKRL